MTTAITNDFANGIKTARELKQSCIAESTRKTYANRFQSFIEFCNKNNRAVNVESVAAYIGALVADKEKSVSLSFVQQTVSAIKYFFESKGMESPTDNKEVKQVLKGLRRTSDKSVRQVSAITPRELKALISHLQPFGIKKYRDRAMLLIGFAGAFRRSELAALAMEDIERVVTDDGEVALQITLRRSKTDQEGHGQIKVIFSASDSKLCPIKALDAWLKVSGITEGAIFRHVLKSGEMTSEGISGQIVARVIKQAAQAAGISKTDTNRNGYDFSGHSLRRGFVTTAFKNGASDLEIMRQTGHKSATTLNKYKEIKNAFEHNAAKHIL